MLFNSLEYAIFLVVVFLVYWALARTKLLRIVFLLLASYTFYASSNPLFLSLIVASTVTDYFAGLAMSSPKATRSRRKLWLVISLCMNLGLLAVFKYSNFFYETAVDVANLFDLGWEFERLEIMLPVGISFYTFQTMSYSIDVYRKKCKPEPDFVKFAFFVSYFPQLVAGPIVRAVDFLPQVDNRPYVSRQQASRALWLIGIGLFKKALADYTGTGLVDRVFERPELYGGFDTMVGLYGYTMQVYLDFSAYTDIAIGSALLLGFYLPDNFDRPYKATSIQDFWRRWHQTLGSWLRDYLYYPLGGSRGSDLRTYLNLFITFVLIGMWHGADWTFVVYGVLHASAMCIHRFFRVNVSKRRKPTLNAWGYLWRVFVTLNFVVLARVLFRAQTFEQAGQVFERVLDFPSYAIDLGRYVDGQGAHAPQLLALLACAYVVHWLPRKLVDNPRDVLARLPVVVQGFLLGLAILFIMQIGSGEVPFIYFQF